MSLKKRVLGNGLASILQKAVRVLEQLFLVPFFISAWGAAYYGEWLTLTIIPTVIAFSDFGFGSAAANSFVLSYASGLKQEAANINKSGIYIITLTILAAIFISIVVIFILDYLHVFDKSLIERKEAIVAVLILIITQLLSFYRQLIESYYRAAEKAALSINIVSAKGFFNILGGLLVLTLGYGVVQFAISQLAVTLIFTVVYWFKGYKVIGLFSEYQGIRDKIILRSIAYKGLSYLMLPLWQIVYFQGTTFVVRLVLGPEAVAVFNTVRTLSRSFNQILYLVEPTVFPELINQIGKGAWKTAQQIFRMSIITVFTLSLFGVLFLAVFGLWFYGIWTNNELTVPDTMWYVFISGLILNALWYTTEMSFRAVNKPKQMGFYGIFAAIFSVSLTYLLASKYGLNGAAIGAISIDVILVVLVVPAGCKLMKMDIKELIYYGKNDITQLLQNLKMKLGSS